MKVFMYKFEGIDKENESIRYKGKVYLRPEGSLHSIPFIIFFNPKYESYSVSLAGNEFKDGKTTYNHVATVNKVQEEPFWIAQETTQELEGIALYIYLNSEGLLEEQLRKKHEWRKKKLSNRNCSNCRYKTTVKSTPEVQEDYSIFTRAFCRLRDEFIDDEWLKEKQNRDVEDRGLVDNKSKTTMDKEHPHLAPIAGRARTRGLIDTKEKIIENEMCIGHIYKFKTTTEDEEGKTTTEFVVNHPMKFPWFKQTDDEIEFFINYEDTHPEENLDENNEDSRISVAKIIVLNVTPERNDKDIELYSSEFQLNDKILKELSTKMDTVVWEKDSISKGKINEARERLKLAQQFIDHCNINNKITKTEVLKQVSKYNSKRRG